MRLGFEDWEYFLSILETAEDAVIGMVEKPLIEYRTAPVSANVSSMAKRTELLRYIIEKHSIAYHSHTADVILEMEAIASVRLSGWEAEIIHSMQEGHSLTESPAEFLAHQTYGDGGMAAAVRVRLKKFLKAGMFWNWNNHKV